MGEDRPNNKKIRYFYDGEGLCGFRYGENNNWEEYTYVKNLQGDIVLIKDSNGYPRVKYEYDPLGRVDCVALGIADDDGVNELELGELNPFRYRGYYYDEETGLYYLMSRYYDPEVGQFISPDSFNYLDPQTIGGVNLYAYCLNNPMSISYSSSNANGKASAILSNFNINPLINPILGTIRTLKTLGVHWENKWFAADGPSFFVLTKDGFEVVNWSISLYKGSLYLNAEETHSIYLSGGNVSVYAGINFKKMKGGVKLGGSLASVGFDGKFIDASIDFVGVGVFFYLENGKLDAKVDPIGIPGVAVSIDFGAIAAEIFKIIFGG